MTANQRSEAPWDVLAELLDQPAGLETARLLGYAGLLGPSEESEEAPAVKVEAPRARAIGPWAPGVEEGRPVFVREPFQGEDFIWWKPSYAREVIEIEPAPGKTRICLIGESAAAGMFYTPHYTPAVALAQLLGEIGGADNFEVLDFTRNSMNARELVEVTDAALQLHPHYVVAFAGNNWFASQGFRWQGPSGERRDYSFQLAERGLPGVLHTYQERVRAVARNTLSSLHECAETAQATLLFVVPAVNLLWERAEPVPWLGAGRTAEWFELHASALRALANRNYEAALEHANALRQLDGGICPTSHRLAGKALQGLGKPADAAVAFEAELDHANAFDMFCQSVPGTPAFLRSEIKQWSRDHDRECFDVSEAFARHTGSRLDWQRLFVDYCHMSPEGMQVAMAGVANHILRANAEGAESVPDCRLGAVSELVPVRVEAMARFYSTLYITHLMRPVLPLDAAVIRNELRSALESCPDLFPFVQDYLRARDGELIGNPMLSAAAHRVVGQSNNQFLDYAAVRGLGGVDALAVEALAAALEQLGHPGKAALDQYLQFFKRELDTGVDLTLPVYVEHAGLNTPFLKYESERETRRAMPYHRSIWPTSSFTLVSDATRDVVLRLTLRLPQTGPERGLVRISLNGAPLTELPVERSWQRRSFVIPMAQQSNGCNRLTIDWPALVADEDQALANAARAYRLAQRPELFPCFGELFACVARAL